jgi:hypothetical protein
MQSFRIDLHRFTFSSTSLQVYIYGDQMSAMLRIAEKTQWWRRRACYFLPMSNI